MLSRVAASVVTRAKWARLGVFAGQTFPRRVRIAGRSVALSFPERERPVHEREFKRIVFDDCYRLAEIKTPVRTVLDIGANIGLFALAARQQFPRALILCFEPNLALEPHLAAHCDAIDAFHCMEAIGVNTGRVNLRPGTDSLHALTFESSKAIVPQHAFVDAVARLCYVDVLKLNCEGTEWSLFSDPGPWQRVGALALQYHLWAKPGATEATVEHALRALGFRRIRIEPSGHGPRGLAFATRT
jgi:FkbM family methyltransferase